MATNIQNLSYIYDFAVKNRGISPNKISKEQFIERFEASPKYRAKIQAYLSRYSDVKSQEAFDAFTTAADPADSREPLLPSGMPAQTPERDAVQPWDFSGGFNMAEHADRQARSGRFLPLSLPETQATAQPRYDFSPEHLHREALESAARQPRKREYLPRQQWEASRKQEPKITPEEWIERFSQEYPAGWDEAQRIYGLYRAGAIDAGEAVSRYEQLDASPDILSVRSLLQSQHGNLYRKRLSGTLGAERESTARKLGEHAKANPAVAYPMPYAGYARQPDQTTQDYTQSLRNFDEAQKAIDAFQANHNGTAALRKLGKGVSDKLFTPEAITLGLSGLGDNLRVKRILDKADRHGIGSLSDAEETLLNSAIIRQAVEAANQSGAGYMYNIGAVAGESIPYMLQFILTGIPASAMTKPLTGSIVRYMGRYLQKKGVQRLGTSVAKGALWTADNLLKAAARTPFAPSFYADAAERQTGEFNPAIDPAGKVGYSGHKGDNAADAYGKAFLNSLYENFGEESGAIIDAVSRSLGKLPILSKSYGRIAASRLGKLMQAGRDSGFGEFLRRAGYHGVFGETFEEYVSGALNAATVGDQSFSELFSKDNFITTFGGVGLTSILLGTANGALGAAATRRIRSDWNDAARMAGRSFSPARLQQLRDIAAGTPQGITRSLAKNIAERQRLAGQILLLSERQKEGETGLESQIDELGTQLATLRQEYGFISSAAQYNAYIGGISARISPIVERAKADIRAKSHPDGLTIRVNAGGREGYLVGGSLGTSADAGGNVSVLPAGDLCTVLFDGDSRPAPNVPAENIGVVSAKPTAELLGEATADIYAQAQGQEEEAQAYKAGEGVSVAGMRGKFAFSAIEGETAVLTPLDDGGQPIVDADGKPKTVRLPAESIRPAGQDAEKAAAVRPGSIVPLAGGRYAIDQVSGETAIMHLLNPDGTPATDTSGNFVTAVATLGALQEAASDTDERTGDLPQENAEDSGYRLSDEVDEDGSPFILSSKGNTDFGLMPEESGLTPAPIKLSLGNSKYGRIHLEKRHGNEIRNAGFDSVESFVEYVANNFSRIREGENSLGEANGTYLLQLDDGHNNTLYIELSTDGSYWGVNSGGVFRKGYGENKKEVWSASEEQNKLPATDNTLRTEDDTDNPTAPNGTVSNASGNKVTNSESNNQADGAESPELSATALQRIPKDAQGNLLYEQAEPDTAWDAIVEQAGGDEVMAQSVADGMAADKDARLRKLEKSKPKGGATVAEKIAAERERKQAVEAARHELAVWQRIAETSARRKAAQEEAAADRARQENLQAGREAMTDIPGWHMDTPENARERGSRRWGGQLFSRQEPALGVVGNEVEVKFSQKDLPKARVVVIEAERLQPSHVQGRRNPMHFIDEAQPKNRAEAVSAAAAKQMAEAIRPEEITGSTTAYTGAPTVNARGEVIQGNNRSDALRYLWENELPEQQRAYKQYLIGHAERFGIDPDAVAAMQHPVLVNMLDVDDAEAIRLGQLTAQDTESGGTERIKPKNVAQKLGDNMRLFANMLLLSADDGASFGQLVDRNGQNVLNWLNRIGAISDTQYRSAFDSRGNLTPEARNDLQKVLYQAVFKGGSQQLEEMFGRLPAKAQRAILSTAFRDMDSPFAGKMLPEIQASVIAYGLLMQKPAFADAKGMEETLRAVEGFKRTTALDDRLEHYLPADDFSNFALHLAAMYKANDLSQNTIASYFNRMYDLAQGRKAASIFEAADTTKYPLAEAIKQVLGFEYKPAKNGKYNVTNGGAHVALRNQGSQGGELRGSETPASGEQNPAGTQPSDRAAAAADDSRGRGNIQGSGAIQENVAADKEPQSPSVEPQLPIGDLFGGLFDEPQTTAPAKGKELDPTTKKVADILKGGGLKPSKAKNDNLVKLLGQHEAMKQKHPDALLLFRSGNNYQVLSADAEAVADLLNLPLSKFTKDGGEIPFTEFPHHALDKYLPQMVRAGKRVAVCEQIDEPKVTTERKPKSETTTSKPKSDEKRTDVQPRPEETGRGGQQPRPNEPLGESAKHEDERTDGGRVAQRGGEHSVPDPVSEGTDAPQTNLSESKIQTAASQPHGLASAGKDTANSPISNKLGEKIAAAEAETDTEPSPAQAEAGNYKKGHVAIGDFDVTIENPAGSTRRGVDANGKKWETTMRNTYGYILGTEGVDGDHIDVFLHRDMDGWNGRKAFVVDQTNPDGSFDEHKVMLGFNDMDEAMSAYLANYDASWAQTHPGLRISEASIDDFNKWVQSSRRKTKPFAEYSNVSKVTDGTPTQSEPHGSKAMRKALRTISQHIDTLKKQRQALERVNADTAEIDAKIDASAKKYESERRKLIDAYSQEFSENGETVAMPVDEILSEAEFIDLMLAQDAFPWRKNSQTDFQQWEETDEYLDEYNRVARLYPAYIRQRITDRSLQQIFDGASIGERIRIREAVEAAGFNPSQEIERPDAKTTSKKEQTRRQRQREILDRLGIPTREPIGTGFFGKIYDGFKGKVRDAVEFIANNKGVDLLGVFHRDGYGDIDLVSGDKNGGWEHILGKHVGRGKSFATADDAAEAIDRIIREGEIVSENGDKTVFEQDGQLVTIRKNIRDKGKKIADKNWVLTAYDEEAADNETGATHAANEVQAAQDAAQSRGKDTNSESDKQADGKETSESAISQESGQVHEKIEGEGYSISPKPYTNKQGKTLDTYLVTFDRDFSKEEMQALRAKAKAMKGWHDRETRGWMLRGANDAKAFAEDVMGKSAAPAGEPAAANAGNDTKAPERPKQAPVKKVDLEGVFGDLLTKGEAKLSDHAAPAEAANPSGNRLVSDERYAELRERMRKKLRGQMNLGIDPEILAIGTEMAVYHIEKGARKFAEYAKAMIADLGDAIRPYLKSFYNAVRDMPEAVAAGLVADMDGYDDVRRVDIANFDKPYTDPIATAKAVIAEQAAKNPDGSTTQRRIIQAREKEQGKKKALPSQPQATQSLFDALFHATGQEASGEGAKKDNDENENEVQLQPRPGTAERERGHQPRQNEPLGEGKRNEDEFPLGRGMGGRSLGNTVPDTERGGGIPELHPGERGLSRPKNTRNNHAERGVDYAPKGEKARIDANIAAIKLSKELLASGETATPEQMEALRRYSGWGGLGAAFNEGGAGTPNPANKQLRELLTQEEYDAAVMSRNSAYYTPAPVIDAMWDIAKALGFKGGNILEGSAGIGNILGQMPTDISERSDIHAIEIDGTTGGILSLLYPDAKVDVQGFEQARIGNGTVDLAITNVPFVTGLHVMDESGDRDLSKKFRDIHDFCIAKNVRKLREGAIGIFITSSGTLDRSQNLRNWLVADKEGNADVVGAFRMNNQTFGGTAATSDIIVVRKRVNGRKSANAIDVSAVSPLRTAAYTDEKGKTKDLPLVINSFFIEHPEYMGGEMFFGFEQGDTYRPTSIGLFPTRTANQAERMAAWVRHLADLDWAAENVRQDSKQEEQINEALGEGVKEGSMLLDSKGDICIARMGRAIPLTLNKNKIKGRTKEQCFKDYTEIKDALAQALKYQTEHDDNQGLKPLLDRLNRAYDAFVRRYGHLNKNNNLAWLRNDVDFPSIAALETYAEKGNKDGSRTKTYGKTDIFSRRVVEKESEPNPKNVKDGIIASIYKFGRIDTEYLASRLGKPKNEIKREIIESGLGFEDPTTGQMEVSYEYLSGNVREKLRQAREADETSGGAYAANVKALEAVVPMNIPAHLIEFTLGSSWVEPRLYEKFIKERTGLDVRLTNAGGTWHMEEPWNVNTTKNKEMGIRSETLGILIPGHKLIEAALANKTITVSKTYKDNNGTHAETDPAATIACAAKVDEIRQDFKDWARERMQADPELSMRMEETYNERFNNSVPKSIPDAFVPEHFGGAATRVDGKLFHLRPHQAKAVIRATTQPVMLAHEVGTGKTYTLITAAMEMRRLGTARKPMIVVQNATVGQFVASAKALYPNAKVLTLEDADRNAEGRRAFYAKIKFNDWDMIVVPQSVFERIPDSIERQTQFIQDKIEEKLLVLEQMKDADPNGRSLIVRSAEREIANLENEIAQLANGKTENKKKGKDAKKAAIARQNAEAKAKELLDRDTDDVEDFDSMGIDAILVDEAYEYKHLGFATAMQRGVKGIDPSPSKKSQGVYLKAQAVLEKTGGKNVVFATGTPISNTAAEIWTFMRYLMPADVMKEYGIYYFDDFVRNFGNLQQMLEFKTNGKYAEVNRFAGYVNLPELVRIWSTVADTVLTREAGGVSDKIPEMEGGKAQDIFLPQTRALRSIMKFVKGQLDDYDKMGGKEKRENSHIPLVMYGIAKAAAVDARLVQRDADDDPNSKTNEAVRQTLRSLKETAEYNGTVAIFADNYQNKASGFNLYEDIRKKLIAAGVPEGQVVVMKPGMSVKRKLEIFDRVNAGEVRVVLGSTFTLGTGVNIQERLHTLIHLDAPNRPMDYTQRNGRILRQGNMHKEWGKAVRILRFGVEDSLDVTAYQRLKTKGAIADSIMDGKQLLANAMENRSLEEEQDLFGDITAQLSGSEYAMLKNQVEKEVRKLKAELKAWESDQTYIHNRKRQIDGQNKEADMRIAENKGYLGKVEAAKIGGITVGKRTYSDMGDMEDFFTEQNKKKAEMQRQVRTSGYYSRPATSDITISIGGFDFRVHTEISRETKQAQGDLFYSAPAKMTYSCPELGIDAMPVKDNLIKNALTEILEDVLSGNDFRMRIEAAERSIERNNAELKSIEARDGVPFKFAEKLAKAEEKLEEYEELMKQEMEAKEAKYADLDKEVEAASDIELTEEETEESASETREDILFRELPDADIRFREVDDDAVLSEFAEGKTVKAYRTMQVIDGKLYSPMATKVGGRETPEIRLGVPEQSEEHPETIKGTKIGRDGIEQGYAVIDKGLGKGTLTVAYNPYIHASRSVLNDQFSSAYIRPNLVTVEVEIPVSELTSGYRAPMAKNAVGEIAWHSGSVSSRLADIGKPRRVILSRYDKPVRILPYREVAERIAGLLDGTGIAIPYNVVQPQVRAELERLGVDISDEAAGSIGENADFGRAEYVTGQEIERINANRQVMPDTPVVIETNEANHSAAAAKRERIGKLRSSKPVEVAEAMIPAGLDLTDRKAVKTALKEKVRTSVTNQDTGETISVFKDGINEATSHGMSDKAHVKSLFAIPEMLAASIFIDEKNNEKGHTDFEKYRYYVCGLKIDGEDYTAKIVVGVRGNERYYDHRLSKIEKGKLIDSLNGLSYSEAENKLPSAESKGTTLQSLLQVHDGENVESDSNSGSDPHLRSLALQAENAVREAMPSQIGRTIRRLAERMQLPVTIVSSIDEIPDSYVRRYLSGEIDGKKHHIAGYYDPAAGRAYLILPELLLSADPLAEAERTILHEAVAHLGMPALLGQEAYDELCDRIWKSLPPEECRRWAAYVLHKPVNALTPSDLARVAASPALRQQAADEYIASIAEKGVPDPTLWQRVKDFFRRMLRRIGLYRLEPTDDDIRFLLSKARQNLARNNRTDESTAQTSGNVRYSSARIDEFELEYAFQKAAEEIAKEFGAQISGGLSRYFKGKTASGRSWQLRISSHPANFDNVYEHLDHEAGEEMPEYFTSIVVTDGFNPSRQRQAALAEIQEEMDWKGIGISLDQAIYDVSKMPYADIETEVAKFKEDLRLFMETGRSMFSPADGEEIRFRESPEDDTRQDDANDRFNRELDRQIDGSLPDGHVYQLGTPSQALLSAGLPDLPIEMAASRLSDKATQENHPFQLSEIKDLPRAIQNPIAVFRSATHLGSFVVMTEIEHRGRNFVVAIQANRKKGRIEVNDIRSVHYRSSNAHMANWITEGLLEYADKKRMVEWLSKQRYNSAEVRKLFNHATNIINSFENPKFDNKNFLFRERPEDAISAMEQAADRGNGYAQSVQQQAAGAADAAANGENLTEAAEAIRFRELLTRDFSPAAEFLNDANLISAAMQENDGRLAGAPEWAKGIATNTFDAMRPLKKLLDKITANGGILPDDVNPYLAENASRSRAQHRIAIFGEDYRKPLVDAIARAIEALQRHSSLPVGSNDGAATFHKMGEMYAGDYRQIS